MLNKIISKFNFYFKFYQNAKILNFNKNNKKTLKNKILIATSSGGLYSQLVLESAIAGGLRARGAEVHFLLCNKGLTSCIIPDNFVINEDDYLQKGPNKFCNSCFEVAKKYLNKSSFTLKTINSVSIDKKNEYLGLIEKTLDFKNIKNFTYKNIKVGEHAVSGTLRYYRKTEYEKEKFFKEIIKKYLVSCLITVDQFYEILKKEKYNTIVLNHGIYVPQGVIAEIAKREKIHFVVWCPGVRKKTFSFSPNDTYHRESIYEDNKNWENITMNEKKKNLISEYLQSKSVGKNDWKNEWVYTPTSSNDDIDKLFDELKIDKNKPLIGLPTNVIWDAQIDYPTNFFNHILEWLFFTIDHFIKNQNLQLIIRVHPGEVNFTKPSKQRVIDEIFKKYGTLPKNIFFVKPEENYNTYKILKKCDNILIYGSRLGIEMSALGKTVIVAGEGFIRNKKIAIDIGSIEEYQQTLNKLPIKNHMTQEKVLRAQKYAYHFFFRRMINLDVLDELPLQWPNFKIKENFSEMILNKKDKGFEKICDCILNHQDFIFDEIN